MKRSPSLLKRGFIMGTSTNAHCDNCGYAVFLILGGGIRNHTTYCAWPVTCESCKGVTIANFNRLPLKCLDCGSIYIFSFDEPTFWKGDGSRTVQWGELELTDGHYRCPRCGRYHLRFRDGGIIWD